MALGRALQPAVAEIVTVRGFEIMPAPEDGFVHPVSVRLGPSDGARTEILGDALKENDQVVVGEARRDNAGGGGGTVNPFTPQQFRSSRPQ